MTTKLVASVLVAAAIAAAADKVTFSENIAPIVYQNCVTCHRPGEAAPFALITYDDVKKRGSLITAVTKSRYMPPWHAAHGYGDFAGERRLTDAQIAMIGDWVSQGMPEGDPKKMPKLPQFTEGWQLGKPDLILEMPKGFDLPASGPDVYRNFVIPTGLTEDKWVRAVEFRPSARKVVHHALFAYTGGGALKAVDGADGKPGFGGMGSVGVAPGQGNSGSLGGWAVGGAPISLQNGLAYSLPKGADFLLQLHFHLTGKLETERSLVGIYFADKAPERAMQVIGLPALFGFGSGIDIPAGAKNYTIKDSYTVPVDVKVYSVLAHAHYVGKEMKVTATLPDGSMKDLIWIPDWDFNWQDRYNYKDPFVLPKGTRIDATIRYDNSTENPRNPSSPPKRMLFGEESFDEMGLVGLTATAVNKDDEKIIAQTLNQRTQQAILKGAADGTAQRYLAHQQQRGAPLVAAITGGGGGAAAVVAGLAQASPSRSQVIGIFDRQGKVIQTLGEPGAYNQAAFSPDGTKVVATRVVPPSQNPEVWVYDLASGKGAAVATGLRHFGPVWSPDGKQIAYTVIENNQSTLYRKAADGSGTPELLYKHPENVTLTITDWSSNGVLTFWGNKAMYALNVNGDRKLVTLANEQYNVRGGRFSPDNRFIAFTSDEGGAAGAWQVYVRPFNTGKVALGDGKAINVSNAPAAGGIIWRADGKELLYLTLPQDQAVTAVDVTMGPNGIQLGSPRKLFSLPTNVGGPVQLSSVATRDGQKFVFLVAPPTK